MERTSVQIQVWKNGKWNIISEGINNVDRQEQLKKEILRRDSILFRDGKLTPYDMPIYRMRKFDKTYEYFTAKYIWWPR